MRRLSAAAANGIDSGRALAILGSRSKRASRDGAMNTLSSWVGPVTTLGCRSRAGRGLASGCAPVHDQAAANRTRATNIADERITAWRGILFTLPARRYSVPLTSLRCRYIHDVGMKTLQSRIWLEEDLCDQIAEFDRELLTVFIDFTTYRRDDPRVHEEHMATWMATWQKMQEDIPRLRQAIERRFREMLGVVGPP